MKLTTKQKLFVEAYLQNPNGTAAARQAGYKGNDNTLASVAKENLRKPHISKLLTKRVESEAMSANDVLNQLTVIAKAKLGSPGVRASDKIRALELLGKHHALFTEKRSIEERVTHRVITPSCPD
mgnify:CR=1 FL=1